jgi:hypothetical protein
MKDTVKIIFLLFALTLLLAGCADPWFRAEVTSPVESYDPQISSLPGLPLEIKYDIDGPTPSVSSITYITDRGNFIMHENSDVTNLGKIAELKGKKIYWIPVENNGELTNSARIKVIVSYFDRYIEVSKTFSARIVKEKSGVYTIR